MSRLRIAAVSAALTVAAAAVMMPVQVANAAPNTTVVLPSNNATLSGTQYLDAVAPSGATQVQYELTGGSLNERVIATGTPSIVGWAAAWDTRTVANGIYTLSSVTMFSGGVSATSGSISFTVNNAPPLTTVVAPTGGTTESSENTLVMDAVTSPGVASVTFDLTTLDGFSSSVTAIPTIYGWIGVVPGNIPTVAPCPPIPFPASIQSVASYSGGVSGTSAPVNVVIDVYGTDFCSA